MVLDIVCVARDPALIQAWLRREWNESNGNGSPTSSQGDTQAAMAAFIQSSAAAAAGQHQSTPGGSEAGGAHWPPLGQDGFDAQMFLEQREYDLADLTGDDPLFERLKLIWLRSW